MRAAVEATAGSESPERIAVLRRAAQRWSAFATYRTQLYVLRRHQGRLDELAQIVDTQTTASEYATYPIMQCVLLRIYDEVGRDAEARELFEELAGDGFARLPFDEEWLVCTSFLAETARSLGDAARAATLYERLLPYADRVATTYSEISTGAVSRYLGLLAATLQRWEKAERHFDDALEMNDRIGARPWLAYTQEDYARMLLERSERPRAVEILRLAHSTYRDLGMETHAARCADVVNALR